MWVGGMITSWVKRPESTDHGFGFPKKIRLCPDAGAGRTAGFVAGGRAGLSKKRGLDGRSRSGHSTRAIPNHHLRFSIDVRLTRGVVGRLAREMESRKQQHG